MTPEITVYLILFVVFAVGMVLGMLVGLDQVKRYRKELGYLPDPFSRPHKPRTVVACKSCGLSSGYWDDTECKGGKSK